MTSRINVAVTKWFLEYEQFNEKGAYSILNTTRDTCSLAVIFPPLLLIVYSKCIIPPGRFADSCPERTLVRMDSENKENIAPQHPAVTTPADPRNHPAPASSATSSAPFASIVTTASVMSIPQIVITTSATRSAISASTTIFSDKKSEFKKETKLPKTRIQVYRQHVHSKNSVI